MGASNSAVWKLLIEDDQGKSTTVQLAGKEYGIGRAEKNTIRLTDRNISRHHARLVRRGDDWHLEDLHSYNGCFVNGARAPATHKLKHGDLIQLGDYKLELLSEAADTRARSTQDAGRTSLRGQPDRLVVLIGPNPATEYALSSQAAWKVGRGEECDICINHASVSRVHMELQRLESGRFEAVDRASANGLRINGVELERAILDGRDSIELGDVTLKYIEAGTVYVPSKGELRRISSTQAGGISSTLPAPARIAKAPLPVKITAMATGGVLLLLLLMVAFGGGPSDEAGASAVESAAVAPNDEGTRLLKEATDFLRQNDVEQAHRLASLIPTGHAVRATQGFFDIEARWADRLFEQAREEGDRERKRALLERLVAAQSVDEGRRLRAETALKSLATAGVDIRDLSPEARGDEAPAAVTRGATSGSSGSSSGDRGRQANSTPASKAQPRPTKPDPSPPPTPQALTPEERAKLTRMKDILKAKLNVGKMSPAERQRLKGLCQKLGDASCS